MADDKDDDDRKSKKNRDDDDLVEEDDDRPRKKKARDDDDEGAEDDDAPRKKKSRDDDDDDDRPKKKKSRDDDEDDDRSSGKPMPMRLVGALIVAVTWGVLMLYGNCVASSRGVFVEIRHYRDKAKIEEGIRKDEEQFKIKIPRPERSDSGAGWRYAQIAGHFVMMFMGAVLLGGVATVLMRKSFGKWIIIGAPAVMMFVEVFGFALGLVLHDPRWTFIIEYNIEFFINIAFSLVTAGLIAFLVLNKDVSKALR